MLLMRLLSSHPDVLLVQAPPLRAADRRLLDRGTARAVRPRQLPARRHAPDGRAAGRRGPDVVARHRCPDAVAAARRGSAGVAGRRGGGGTGRDLPAADRRGLRDHRHGHRRHDASLSSPRSRPRVSPRSPPSSTRTAGSCSWCGTSATWCARCSRSTSKRGVSGFGRAEADSDVEFVNTLGGQATSLARAWERRRDRAHLVRYEELVLDPAHALAGLLDHVGVDSRPDTISGHAGRARGGHTRAARPCDERLRTELDRPLAHATSTPSWPRPASGLSARRWSCSATSGNRNAPARAVRNRSRDLYTLPKQGCRVAHESPVQGSAQHGLGALQRLR